MKTTPSIVDCMRSPALFGPWFMGGTWGAWITILKAAFALPMTDGEVAVFRELAGGRNPPKRRVRELWIIAGRRAGKDSIASLIIAYASALFDHGDRLRPGERAVVQCLACDRDQARIIMRYAHAFFARIDLLRELVTGENRYGFSLSNSVDVEISTNSFRSVRGRPILCAVLDECAFYRTDDVSSVSDEELYRAITPGMATLPSSMLVGISSPYRRAGLLWRKYRDSFGRDDSDVLLIQAPSLTLNPTLDPAIVERALEEDAASAKAEWLGEFRTDIESFISREAIEAVVELGRIELPPLSSVNYGAFVDPAGGSGGDSMTLAVAHADRSVPGKPVAILDAVRERKPPFSPDDVVGEFCDLLGEYRISSVTGDRWGGEFVREAFRKNGVRYEVSERSKSDIYKELLPLINSRRVELLDHKKMVSQLCSLERKTVRGGKDSIDHPNNPNAHDDVANAISGALVHAVGGRRRIVITPEMLKRAGERTQWSRQF